MLHIGITVVEAVIDVQYLAVFAFLVALVKYTEHLIQAAFALPLSVCLTSQATTQKGYLYNDTVVCEAVDKWVGQALGHQLPIAVV